MNSSIRQFHEQEKIVAGAQTATGKALVWISGIALLAWHDVNALMLASFTLVLLFPERRRSLLMLAAFGLVAGKFLGRQGIDLIVVLVSPETVESTQWFRFLMQFSFAMTSILAIVFAAIRLNVLPSIVRRHPLSILHLLVCSTLVLSSVPRLGIFALGPMILWGASYMLKSAASGNAETTSLKDHLFYLVPVFGGTNTPYGKGPDYLTRFEAIDPESIARSQLAGIKLLILAIIWAGALSLMDAVIFGHTDTILATSLAPWSLQLAHMADLMQTNTKPAITACWISIYLELIRATIILAIAGHVIIGSLRLLGFNVFRNTYKPLLSESIVEFWNRFYFYFKELLVEFFFYPTFFRCTWAGPRLRLLLAVLAAAFVGNVYYHLLKVPRLLADGDLSALWTYWGPRLIYCFLLALGIWLSMLRQQERRKLAVRVSGLSKFRAIAGVWTFYGLIHIWNITPRKIGFGERWNFLMSLIGL